MSTSSVPSTNTNSAYTGGTTGTGNASSSGNSTQSAQADLSSNFSTFLTLLTTQLQNQDPLSPMDSTQFTQQLVEFSQVEQQINTNSNLQSLISLTQSQASSYAVNYLGKTVTTTDGTGALENSQANWTYALSSQAATTQLMVQDSNGNAVYTGAGSTSAGVNTFNWNGQTNTGTQLPDGTYKLTVTATDASGNAISTQVASQGIVNEVNLSGSTPTLMIGPMSVPLSSATLIGD